MKSQWFKLKPDAIGLRKRGVSIPQIEQRLGIPRSTLSYWFHDVILTDRQKNKLLQRWRNGLVKARKRAVVWHNAQKAARIEEAKSGAVQILDRITISDRDTLELALALLYLGEGSKKNLETAMGNSDPLILRFFLTVLRRIYTLDVKQIKCDLSLRADQNPDAVKRFWATALNLPLSSFVQVHFDKRTAGTKTYPSYHGVCQIRCANVAIQRKLMFLSTLFCERVIKRLGS